MGKKIVMCVRDLAVEAFAQPFFVPHIGAATRSFIDEAKKPETPLAQHPADYELYKIGEFDENTGALIACEPELVMRGMTAVEV